MFLTFKSFKLKKSKTFLSYKFFKKNPLNFATPWIFSSNPKHHIIFFRDLWHHKFEIIAFQSYCIKKIDNGNFINYFNTILRTFKPGDIFGSSCSSARIWSSFIESFKHSKRGKLISEQWTTPRATLCDFHELAAADCRQIQQSLIFISSHFRGINKNSL